MGKLYVTRHGLTQYNKDEHICGATDIPLCEEGLEQAEQLAEKCFLLADIDMIISSPMIRAAQTAQAVADKLKLKISYDERLREWDYGSFEGMDRFTKGFAEAKAAWGCKMPGGGESVFQLVHRTYDFIDDVKKNYPDKNVLVVCHGGICRVIDSYFNDMTVERFMNYFQGNCQLNEYQLL